MVSVCNTPHFTFRHICGFVGISFVVLYSYSSILPTLFLDLYTYRLTSVCSVAFSFPATGGKREAGKSCLSQLTLIQRLSHRLSELKAPEETEVPHPLLIVPLPVPSLDELHVTVRQAHMPATVDIESKPDEAPLEIENFKASEPSDTRITSSYSSVSSDSTAPLSPDHPLTQTSPTPTPLKFSEAAASSPSSFRRRGRDAQQPTLVTWVDPEDGRVYTGILDYVPPVSPVQTLPSPEWSSGSLPVSPSSLAVSTPVASPVTTPAATIAIDKDKFLEIFRSLEREQERAMVTFSAIWRLVLALEAVSAAGIQGYYCLQQKLMLPSSRVTTADRVSTAGWIKTKMA
nr:hypothetical protein [Tanacetum cinerariifolium]